jgi:hypothetical protein
MTAVLAHSLSHNVDFSKASKEVEAAAVKAVDNWDIRGAERLRAIFPEAFPESLREGKLIAYMRDSDAEWVVEVNHYKNHEDKPNKKRKGVK